MKNKKLKLNFLWFIIEICVHVVTCLVQKLTIPTAMNHVMGIKISCVEVAALSTILCLELEGDLDN